MKYKKTLAILFIFLISAIFFKSFIFQNKLPIPADTIIGIYHPFRDLYAKNYPNGIPFKNFLITDPVRQQFPWRELSISLEKRLELPLWNPYSMSGVPLMANIQSASLYPLNLIFFVAPFNFAWSFLIFLEPVLAGVFIFLFLKNLKLANIASIMGAVVFAFCGFSIAWMEWGTILHVGLWLPLILLSIDKIFSPNSFKKNKFWFFLLILSISFSFLAGHLQVFFYVFLTAFLYILFCFYKTKNTKAFLLTILSLLLFILVTSIQWIPMLKLINESGRNLDQINNWQKDGWFIPWQNLIQFIAPDFFGNPATLNYWGVWNYGEFIGYAGIIPLIFSIFSLFKKDKTSIFFWGLLIFSLIFSLPTFLAKIPFIFGLPFISTAQPTRLLFISDFSLAILTAFGFDLFVKNKKYIIVPVFIILLTFLSIWFYVLYANNIFKVSNEELLVAKRNLTLSTILFFISSFLVLISFIFKKESIKNILYSLIVIFVVFDLFRFGLKFTPFTDKNYLFPPTEALSFIKSQKGNFRVMTVDQRIFTPNFSVAYKIQTVDGYDPLYLLRYGELIVASERGKPDINPPFGFNRIIQPLNYNSKIIDLLGVKYVLSLNDLMDPKLKKVFQEGKTLVYENTKAANRAFFVEEVKKVQTKKDALNLMFDNNIDLSKVGIIEDGAIGQEKFSLGRANIINYSENKIIISTENRGNGFLILTDSFYPTWNVKIDGINAKIYRADFNFRGVLIPKGLHTIEFYDSLL